MIESQDMTVSEVRDLLASTPDEELGPLLARLARDPRAGVAAACESARRRTEAAAREQARLAVLYATETGLQAQGFALVAGVDEVGRGAVAGPLSAAAVVLPISPRIPGLDDSKRLTPARRTEVASAVREVALHVCVAHIAAGEIDRLGVTTALRRVMGEALAGLGVQVGHVLVDGLPMRVHPCETAVVGGDAKVAAIAAASVVAKVERDALMRAYAEDHPRYGFAQNKGYGSADHLDAIREHGPCILHRRSFLSSVLADTLF